MLVLNKLPSIYLCAERNQMGMIRCEKVTCVCRTHLFSTNYKTVALSLLQRQETAVQHVHAHAHTYSCTQGQI